MTATMPNNVSSSTDGQIRPCSKYSSEPTTAASTAKAEAKYASQIKSRCANAPNKALWSSELKRSTISAASSRAAVSGASVRQFFAGSLGSSGAKYGGQRSG